MNAALDKIAAVGAHVVRYVDMKTYEEQENLSPIDMNALICRSFNTEVVEHI